MDALEKLIGLGYRNPNGIINSIHQEISKHKLDLTGLTVTTEAASGPFFVTPIIAALANASKIFAITADSAYAKKEDVKRITETFMDFAEIPHEKIIISYTREKAYFEASDIITNLGFVRPISAEIIDWFKETAVIPLMFEAWEFRYSDLDIEACIEKKIPVMGTNENHEDVRVFELVGLLVMKLLLDAEIDFLNKSICVISQDYFGNEILKFFSRLGKEVLLISDYTDSDVKKILKSDVFIISDYISNEKILFEDGKFDWLVKNPDFNGKEIIQLAGCNDVPLLKKKGCFIYPDEILLPQKMSRNLSHLGVYPVVKLNTAGLKVGEYLYKQKLKSKTYSDTINTLASQNSLCQKIQLGFSESTQS